MSYVLIIMAIHAGTFKKELVTYAYFSSRELCEQAGEEIGKLTSGVVSTNNEKIEDIKTKCVRVK